MVSFGKSQKFCCSPSQCWACNYISYQKFSMNREFIFGKKYVQWPEDRWSVFWTLFLKRPESSRLSNIRWADSKMVSFGKSSNGGGELCKMVQNIEKSQKFCCSPSQCWACNYISYLKFSKHREFILGKNTCKGLKIAGLFFGRVFWNTWKVFKSIPWVLP